MALRDAQRQRDLKTLNKSALQLSKLTDETAVYAALVQAAVDTLECDYCTVFLAQPDGMLVSEESGGTLFTEKPKLRFTPSQGLAGLVYRTGEPLVVADTSKEDLYWRTEREQREGINPRSILLAPLRKGEKVVGVLSADFDRVGAFDDGDKRLLETLAAHAGVVLLNIEAFKDLGTVHDAAAKLTQLPDMEHIYRVAVEETSKAVHCNHSTLHVFDRNSGELVPVGRAGAKNPEKTARRFQRGEGLAGVVFETGTSILLGDASKDDRFLGGNYVNQSVPRSILVVPVRANGDVFGVLSADNEQVNGFTEGNLRTLETLAIDVGVAIKARQLQDRLQAVSEFQRALGDVVHLQEQLPELYQLLSKLIDTSGLYIGLYRQATDTIEFPLAYQDGQIVDDVAKTGSKSLCNSVFWEARRPDRVGHSAQEAAAGGGCKSLD